MSTIRIDFDAEALQALDKRVRLLTDQNLRYVAARALTGAAQAAQQQLKQATPRYIDNPTRWTLGGTFVRFARADNLTAEVGFRQDKQGRGNPAGKYLQPIVKGTTPKLKGADLSASKVAGLPRGAVLVPVRSNGLVNASGNVSLSSYAKVIGGLRDKSGGYFIGNVTPGGSVKGIFRRGEGLMNRTSTVERYVKLMFVLDQNPKQRRRQFPVRQVLEQGFTQAWRRELAAAFDAEVARRLGKR